MMQQESAIALAFRKLEQELPSSCFYHNFNHTQQVLEAVKEYGMEENLPEAEQGILNVAAAYHDLGFLFFPPALGHEERSAALAAELLPQFGATAAEIQQICQLILSTRIPTSPQTVSEKILCDADLVYLGKGQAVFLEAAGNLRRELQAAGKRFRDREFLDLEIEFLRTVRFYTESGRCRCESLCRQYLTQLLDKKASLHSYVPEEE